MISASKAHEIAKTANIHLEELKEIEDMVEEAAKDGEYYIEIHRGYQMPFHPKTIKILVNHGYTIDHSVDEYERDYYRISWF